MTVRLCENRSRSGTKDGQLFSLGEVASAIGTFCKPEWTSTGIARVSTDSRKDCSGALFVALRGEKFDGHNFICQAFAKGAAAAIVSNSHSEWNRNWRILVVEDTLGALAQLASHQRDNIGVPVVAITGSCGKTTTKELLTAALSAKFRVAKSCENFNNIIGVSLTLLSVRPEDEIVVVELGTNAPGEIAQLSGIVRPTMGIITNIGHSHLEKLCSVKGVKREKSALLQFLGERGVLVTNSDCEECRELAAEFSGKTITVAIDREADITATIIDENDSNLSLRIGDLETRLALSGAHNVYNALLAAAAAEELGVEREEALKAFASLSPLKMRLHAEAISGVTIIDDTYNSNFESLKAALRYLESLRARARKILVVGDMLELGCATERLHKAIGGYVKKSRIDVLITVGQWAGLIALEAHRGQTKEVFQRRTVDEIAPLLTRLVRTGDAILFKASRAVHLEDAVEEFKNRLRENYPVTVNCAR
jgi:UDP-N-acetylmuramoyl-tripeptide--D-alanyl-D-alanine ligase